MTQTEKRNINFDFIRVISIICIVIIHSSIKYNRTPAETLIGEWLNFFTRFSVPCFLFLSGFLFQPWKREHYLKFRLKRLFFPYIIFSVLALLYKSKGELAYIARNFHKILFNLFFSRMFVVYYFIFVIIIIFLIVQLFYRKNLMDKNCIFIFFISLILAILHYEHVDRLGVMLGLGQNDLITFKRLNIFYWLPFFLLGIIYRVYQLQEIIYRQKTSIRIVWGIIFVSYNFFFFIKLPGITFYETSFWMIYSFASVFFLLTFDFSAPSSENQTKNKIKHRFYCSVTYTATIGYTIYLIHIFITYLFRDFITRCCGSQYSFALTLTTSILLSFFGSILLGWLLKKILGKKSEFIIGS